MKWDMADQYDPSTWTEPAPAPVEREIMPAGRHTMTIRHAEEGPNEFKRSDENPEGICLKLRLSDAESKYRFVFDDLPHTKSLAWRARQLAVALGIDTTSQELTIEPEAIKGRTVEVEISHYTSKAGKVSAVVKRYIEAKAQQPAKPRTTAARVKVTHDDDVVPF